MHVALATTTFARESQLNQWFSNECLCLFWVVSNFIQTLIDQTSTYIMVSPFLCLFSPERWVHTPAHYSISRFYLRTIQPSVCIYNPLIRLLHHCGSAVQGSSSKPLKNIVKKKQENKHTCLFHVQKTYICLVIALLILSVLLLLPNHFLLST